MFDLLVTFLLFAQDSPGPRGDNPDDGGGIVIIVAIVVALALGGLLLHFLLHRFGRSRARAMERHPAEPGQVGRSSEFRERS